MIESIILVLRCTGFNYKIMEILIINLCMRRKSASDYVKIYAHTRQTIYISIKW